VPVSSPERYKTVRNFKCSTAQKKRILTLLCIVLLCFFALFIRLFYWQVIRGEDLSLAAHEQQTTDSVITPDRGLIYDRNYTVLANNMTVETISITPSITRDNEDMYYVAKGIADILELEAEDILAKMERESYFEYIKKKVPKDKADEVRNFIAKNKVKGFSFTEDTKRYYPYGAFASQVIGFTGGDNQGLEGIEMVYNDVLSGTSGRLVSNGGVMGLELPDSYENYVAPEEGRSIVLTIDETIQHYVEKHIENARIENELEEGAACIVMDIKTGEILAMATAPDYDLNQPFAINQAVIDKYPEIEEELEDLEGDEYNAKITQATQFLKRNKAVVDSYEPGSTFKVAVASMALEENLVDKGESYYCGGSIKVADRSIRCANTKGHGSQTFSQAVQNSCNPAFITIGQKIGTTKFLKYLKGFGFLAPTGIELPGETSGIFHSADNFKEIDLATSSFGQSFNVTPLQMVQMAAGIANGGRMMKPHLVKQVVDKDLNVIQDIEPTFVRQIVSKETSEKMMTTLESVVSVGGGKNAYLAGYRIAGKTGTSEKQPRGNGHYVASFLGIAPADEPRVVCLVILDQPKVGNTYYGGLIAAPVVKNIMDETLQYLGVEPKYTQEEMAMIDITVPNVMGKTPEEAKKALITAGLTIKTVGNGEKITDQMPKAYSKVAKNSVIYTYTGDSKAEQSVTVPNVLNMTASQANKALTDAGLNVKIRGLSTSGGIAICTGMSPKEGTALEPGSIVTLDFSYAELRD